jgi:V/A-type H+-transporting ATPase subunit E
MMALRDLLATIEAEATADVARLRAERRQEAAAILAEAERHARELEAAALAEAQEQERQAAQQTLAAARDASAHRVRAAQEAAYQQIDRDVRTQLETVRKRGDYPAILAALLAEACAALPAATLVRVDPADEPLARHLLCGDEQLQVEATLHCAGGVEVTDGAGASVRNTVEERLTAAQPLLRALVGKLLGSDPDGGARTGPQLQEVPA